MHLSTLLALNCSRENVLSVASSLNYSPLFNDEALKRAKKASKKKKKKKKVESSSSSSSSTSSSDSESASEEAPRTKKAKTLADENDFNVLF